MQAFRGGSLNHERRRVEHRGGRIPAAHPHAERDHVGHADLRLGSLERLRQSLDVLLSEVRGKRRDLDHLLRLVPTERVAHHLAWAGAKRRGSQARLDRPHICPMKAVSPHSRVPHARQHLAAALQVLGLEAHGLQWPLEHHMVHPLHRPPFRAKTGPHVERGDCLPLDAEGGRGLLVDLSPNGAADARPAGLFRLCALLGGDDVL